MEAGRITTSCFTLILTTVRITKLPRSNDGTVLQERLHQVMGPGSRLPISIMVNTDDESNEAKIPKFNGRPNEDFLLWRYRLEAALKGKGYWDQLKAEGCKSDIKDKAIMIIVGALGDTALRVCLPAKDDPSKMIKLLESTYASNRAASKIFVLTSVFGKRWDGNRSMSKYIDEFNQLFTQLATMGKDAMIPEKLRAPILLASFGSKSEMENCIAALRMKDDIPAWESLTADLILEYSRLKESSKGSENNKRVNHVATNGTAGRQENNGTFRRPLFAALANSNPSDRKNITCGYCGRKGHSTQNCFWNPANPNNKLSDGEKKSIIKALTQSNTKKNNANNAVHFGGFSICTPKNNSKSDKKSMVSKTHPNANKKEEHGNHAIDDQIGHGACLDSGANKTFFRSQDETSAGSYVPGSISSVQLAAGSKNAPCLGEGTLELGPLSLPDSIHVKNLNTTLVSVPQICDQDKIVVFTKSEAVILDTNKFAADRALIDVVVSRDKESGLYMFPNNRNVAPVANAGLDISLLHQRMIHANERVVRKSLKQARMSPANNIGKPKGKLKPCHPCALGKAHKQPFKSFFSPAKLPGEVVHSDLSGPLPTSTTGANYLCTFVDQATRHISVATFAKKSDAENANILYEKSSTASYFPFGIQTLHSDGGGEYAYADDGDHQHTSTTANTPQHNPFAERANRTIFDPVRTLLEESGLSKKYWDMAANHVAYVKNRLYNKEIKCSPYEKLTKSKPSIHYIRVFGCAAFIYNEDAPSKVHARAQPGIYLGSDDNGVHTCEILNNRRTVYSRNVTFDETSFPALEFDNSSSSGSDNEEYEIESSDDTKSYQDSDQDSNSDKNYNAEKKNSNLDKNSQEISSRPNRTRKQTQRYKPSGNVAKYFAGTIIDVPVTTSDEPSVKNALEKTSSAERELWIDAINSEFEELENSKTWKKVSRSSLRGKKPFPTHIVLKVKRNSNGDAVRFKARVVVGGNFQVRGVDYDEVYAPVVDFSIVRMFLVLALNHGWSNRHVDVKAAFLNSNMDREAYVTHPVNLPKGMRHSDVYLLLKALYGLHQAPVLWFRKLMAALKSIGFIPLNAECAVLILREEDGIVIVLCYVDDLIFFSTSDNILMKIVAKFLEIFNGTDLGEVRWYLGVALEITDACISLTQTAYIDELVKEHHLENSNPVYTPMVSNFHDEAEGNKDLAVIPNGQYRSIIGSLLFASTRTRPDISTAVGILSQFVERPTSFLLKAAKRVLIYLNTTRKYGLVYSREINSNPDKNSENSNLKSPSTIIVAASDADHAGCKVDRKSRSGFIAAINGSAVQWWSRKQTSTALCTAESEYISMTESCKEISWMRKILEEIGCTQTDPTILRVDNAAAESWAKAESTPRRAKHIDLRYHKIREYVKAETIAPQHVPSSENEADGMTKPLGRFYFEQFREKIGVRTA